MSQRNWAEKPSGYEPARVYDVEDEPAGPDTIVYKRYSFFSCTEWVLEIVTSIGSLVILAAVAAIFATVDGHPLSDWTFPISLNAVISILTTACSAAIMHGVSTFISQLKWLHFKNGPQKLEHLERFDEASRGPLGSLKFLVSMKWNLATIGALVTIFRLALSPLAQQVVKIEERVVYKNDTNVTLGYTHTYNRPLDYPDLRGVPQDPNMQAAILQGLYNISIPATFACPLTCLSTQKVHTASGTSFYMNASVAEDEFPEIARFGIYRATSDGGFNQYDMNITECSLSLAAYKYTGARSEGTSFGFTKTEMIELSGNRTGPPSERGNIFTGITLTKANDLPPFYMSTYELGALRQFFMSEAIVTKWVDGYRADLAGTPPIASLDIKLDANSVLEPDENDDLDPALEEPELPPPPPPPPAKAPKGSPLEWPYFPTKGLAGTITLDEILPSTVPITTTGGFETLCSYNWVDTKDPTIIVPGKWIRVTRRTSTRLSPLTSQ
ncbi:hypothetical protein CGCF413_v010227 [Colletotrichum fructicola]|nr:hypothetical protein CGCF413_v010227 [Colletotrichum fructicola]